MRKRFYTTALMLLMAAAANAQGKNQDAFNPLTAADFVLPASSAIDSSSNAVIIADIGTTKFKGNDKGWVSYIFKRRTRIKILNKKAFELATVKIPLYTEDDARETLENFSATSYNLENGTVVPTKMERRDLFIDKIDRNHVEQKFTVPGVRENSIIEYSYTIISDFYFRIPEWSFQSMEYPCLWSEYQVNIPGLVGYIFTRQGVHPFFIDKAEDGNENYLIKQSGPVGVEHNRISINANTVKHRWVMKDVPAFYVENYLFSPENYVDKIAFQLSQTYDGSSVHEVKNTWSKFTEDMLQDKDFAAFTLAGYDNAWLNKYLLPVVKNTTDPLETAKLIYAYVSGEITCTNYHRLFIKTNLQDVARNKKGSVGEINLLLTNMLLSRGIVAAPVILSTREFGYNLSSYPVLGMFDYVICKATIDNHSYYLDASRPYLGFGHLPANCYNGHARVISADDSTSVYFLADSLKEGRTTMVSLYHNESSPDLLEGHYESKLGYLSSYELRETVGENGDGQKKYFDALQAAATDGISFTETAIDSLKQIDLPVVLKADFKVTSLLASDIIYFNPILWGGYRSNPFQAAIRKYPVEMSFPINESYVFNMDIPAGFVVDELPKSTKVSFNEGEGYFEYLVQKNPNSIQLRTIVSFKKSFFAADDYNALRDFWGLIVKKHSEQIVFKRKK